MKLKDLKKLSISNLILIILNDKCNDALRKCSEFELRTRIKNFGRDYDDLLHFDDKVIKKRGFDINNYLISPHVNMQKLMNTYFAYSHGADYESNCLLFSEKHLCNEIDIAEPFFSKICQKEIRNINHRLKDENEDKESLLLVKQIFQDRQTIREEAREYSKWFFTEYLTICDALFQLSSTSNYHRYLNNINAEEKYRLLSSKLGQLKVGLLEQLDDSLYDSDAMQNLYALHFIKKDSRKLNEQKRKLLNQVENGYIVDYQSDTIQKALQRVKK